MKGIGVAPRGGAKRIEGPEEKARGPLLYASAGKTE